MEGFRLPARREIVKVLDVLEPVDALLHVSRDALGGNVEHVQGSVEYGNREGWIPVAVPHQVGDGIAQVHAGGQALVLASGRGLVMMTDRDRQAGGKVPAFEQPRPDLRVVAAEVSLFGVDQGSTVFDGLNELLVTIGHGRRQDDLTHVVKNRGSKDGVFILRDLAGNQLCPDGRGHRVLPEIARFDAVTLLADREHGADGEDDDLIDLARAEARDGREQVVDGRATAVEGAVANPQHVGRERSVVGDQVHDPSVVHIGVVQQRN